MPTKDLAAYLPTFEKEFGVYVPLQALEYADRILESLYHPKGESARVTSNVGPRHYLYVEDPGVGFDEGINNIINTLGIYVRCCDAQGEVIMSYNDFTKVYYPKIALDLMTFAVARKIFQDQADLNEPETINLERVQGMEEAIYDILKEMVE